jgi:hypothetical protein
MDAESVEVGADPVTAVDHHHPDLSFHIHRVESHHRGSAPSRKRILSDCEKICEQYSMMGLVISHEYFSTLPGGSTGVTIVSE